MLFVVRTPAETSRRPELEVELNVKVVLVRRTPTLVASSAGQVDLFCVGDESAPEQLAAQSWQVVKLHDGWYADDQQGGIAVWGQARFWERRETPFDITLSDRS